MSDKRLGIEIQTNAASANKELNTMTVALNQVSASLQKAGYAVKSVKTIKDSMGQYKKAVVTASNANVTLKQTIDKLGKTTGIQTITKQATSAKSAFSKMFDFGKIYAFWNVTKRLRDGMKQMISSAIDFIETTNKFEVSMGSMEKSGYKFINQVSEQFGLAREELMNYQSTYNNIMKSLPGVTEEAAYSISESITKMAIDYASLYNVATEESMTKFQSALVGSVRPIRSESGYDITETTIGEKAKELGVETPVRQLTQMEKRLLRIMVLMDQMKKTGAMGDFARTIEQPANQLKIFSNQVKELGVWLGSVFVGTLGKILPYINGFVMALKEVAKMLALFVGYENVGSIADPLQDASNSTEDMSNNLGGAVKKAKELKRTLMGFDVLNVIQTPKDSSSGSGGAVGNIDPKILNAMKEYDNLMEGVTMKATKIRDKIMEWLGFTKHVNKLTGEVSWELNGANSRISKIWSWIKKIAAVLIGLKLINTIKKIWNLLKLFPGLKIFTGWGAAAIGAIASTFKAWYVQSGSLAIALGQTGSQLQYLLTPLQKVLAVVAASVASFKILEDVTKSVATGTELSTGKIIGLGVALGGIATAVTLLTGPIGLAVTIGAAAVGVIKGAVDASLELKQALANANFFSGLGQSVSDVKNSLQTLTEQTVLYATTLNTLGTENKEWQDTLDQTTNSLNIMLAQFGSESFTITKENVAELGTKLDDLKAAASGASQAFTDYVTNSIAHLEEQGLVSEETADAVVNSAIRKQQAEGRYYEAYTTKVRDLTTKLQQGKISQEKYNKEIAKAKLKLEQNTKAANEAQKKVALLNSKMEAKIKFQSWDEALELVTEMSEQYDEQKKKIEEATDAQWLMYEELKTYATEAYEREQDKLDKMKEGTAAYETQRKKVQELKKEAESAADAQDSLARQQSQSLTDLNKTYQNVITNISTQVKDAGAEIDENGQKVLNSLADLSTTMSNTTINAANKVANASKSMAKSISSQKPTFKLTTNVSDVKKDLENIGNKKLTVKGNIKMSKTIQVPQESLPFQNSLWAHLKSGGMSVSYYAKGGLPDVGEMFVAREAGPELVGTIGNKSAVVNNDQIVQAVSQGVAAAVSSVMGATGGSYHLYIDGQEITDVVSRRMSRTANITGGGYVYG